MPGGFRSFANEINSKVPTYDNFKSNFKGSPQKKRPAESLDPSVKTESLDYVSEAQQWEKYQFDLNQKVKNQRDSIKKMEERAQGSRMKSFE